MKIAVVTNDGRSISAHFGRARQYLVLTIENGAVVEREMRDKTPCDHKHDGHHHDHAHHHDHDQAEHSSQAIELSPATHDHHDHHSDNEHAQKVAAISDCNVVLSRGMGQGMHRNLQRSGIRAVLTDIVLVDEAVQAFLSGQLQERPELVH